MTETPKDVEFLEYVVKAIVDNPDQVKVNREIDEKGVLLVLNVAPEDMGIVIGRKGSTAKAIRTLLRVIGARSNAIVNLRINEPEGGRREQQSEREEREESTESGPKSIDEIVEDIE